MRPLRGLLPAALLLLTSLTACQVAAGEDIFIANRELLQTDSATANPGIAVGEPNPSAPGSKDHWPGKSGWPHGGWGWPKPKPEPRPFPLPRPIPDPKPGPYPKPKPEPYPVGRKLLGSDSVAGADKFGGGVGWDHGGFEWKPQPNPVDPPPKGKPGWGWPKPSPPEPRPYPLPHPIKDPPGMITIPDCQKGPC